MVRLLKYEYLYLFPLLLSAIFSLKSFWQKWPKPYRIFAILVIISLLTEILAIAWKWYFYKMFDQSYSRNNFWIYNIFIIVRAGLLFAFFYEVLNALKIKKVILSAGSILILLSLLNYLFIQGPYQYNTYSVVCTHISIIVLCLCYFHQLLQNTIPVKLHKEPLVWMTFGTFIYHASSLPFLFMLGFLNIEKSALSLLFLPINDTLNMLLCSCYLISFLCRPQPSQLR